MSHYDTESLRRKSAEFAERDPLGYEHTRLSKQLRTWSREYYLFAAPSVPDAEYDRCFKRLQQIERERPDLIGPSSPTQTVGSKN